MTRKRRLSASIDPVLIEAGERAVAAGEAESLSAWVSDALERQVAHDVRIRSLDAFLADYEAEFGEISAEEMEAAARRARANATVVRGSPARGPRRGIGAA